MFIAVAQVCQAVTWDPSFCSWEGSVPFCNSDCPQGNEFRCTTERKSCSTGNKGLCCPSAKQAVCWQIMNGINSDVFNSLLLIDPASAAKFRASCVNMRDVDLSH
ncbi:hypothetical protein BG003_007689 [Podila horticola]|nr:hypothetical protein BG003_007689 [Podila horticola]